MAIFIAYNNIYCFTSLAAIILFETSEQCKSIRFISIRLAARHIATPRADVRDASGQLCYLRGALLASAGDALIRGGLVLAC